MKTVIFEASRCEHARFDFDNRRLGLTICEDIWNAQDYLPARLYDRSPILDLMRGETRAQLLLNLSASPYHHGKERVRYDMLQAVAKQHGVPIVYCNLVGGYDELIFDGNSLAFDGSDGNLSSPRVRHLPKTF